jgi:hypothetical protein
VIKVFGPKFHKRFLVKEGLVLMDHAAVVVSLPQEEIVLMKEQTF